MPKKLPLPLSSLLPPSLTLILKASKAPVMLLMFWAFISGGDHLPLEDQKAQRKQIYDSDSDR